MLYIRVTNGRGQGANVANGMTVRLVGRVSDGMFPNERTFIVTDHNGETLIVIVPEAFVEEHDGIPSIEVRVLGSAHGVSLVRVPGEPLEAPRTVYVAEKDLIPA